MLFVHFYFCQLWIKFRYSLFSGSSISLRIATNTYINASKCRALSLKTKAMDKSFPIGVLRLSKLAAFISSNQGDRSAL